MNKEKIILTDVDGVLLKWDEGFKSFMESKGHYAKPNTEHFYRLSMRYKEFNDKDMMEFVEEFNTSEGVSRLNPLNDAVEYVRKLNDNGYHFICITAISEDPAAREYRDQNLMDVFGMNIFKYEDMVCIAPNTSKEIALTKWRGSGYYWIEDHFTHAETGFELGLQSILMSNIQNQYFKTDLFPRVNNWKEIYEIVTNHIYVDIEAGV